MKKYEASCKLLLFGEYLVLCGAKSLAIPLKFGQYLSVGKSEVPAWKSSVNGEVWFEMSFSNNLEIIQTTDERIATKLINLFKTIRTIDTNVDFNNEFIIDADFDLKWGLGSSSTLISLLSQWSGVSWRTLLDRSFKGSGYDVACALASTPIVYTTGGSIEQIQLSSRVTDNLMFVYSGNKQSSRKEIGKFDPEKVGGDSIEEMNKLVEASINTDSVDEFEGLMERSENLLSRELGREKLKETKFMDYPYFIKSLGAWGGDFFLATFRNEQEARDYFSQKGLTPMFTYNEIMKNER